MEHTITRAEAKAFHPTVFDLDTSLFRATDRHALEAEVFDDELVVGEDGLGGEQEAYED